MFGFILFLIGIFFGAIIGALLVERKIKKTSEKVSDVETVKVYAEDCYPSVDKKDYPSEKEFDLAEGRVFDHRNGYINGFFAAVGIFNRELEVDE